MNVKRGELYYADLSPVVGSEQGGIRPVLVVQNDIGNKYSPTIIAAANPRNISCEIGSAPITASAAIIAARANLCPERNQRA